MILEVGGKSGGVCVYVCTWSYVPGRCVWLMEGGS